MTSSDSERRSLAMVRVGDRLYPASSHASCLTCNSPHRVEIERELLSARSYRAVHEWLDATYPLATGAHPSRESMRGHMNSGHVPLAAAVQRRIIEDRSKEIGADIEAASGAIADHVAVNRVIVQRGLERLTDGEITPSMGDLLAAIRQQQQIDSEHQGGLDAEVWRQAMMEYMVILAGILTPQQRADLARKAASSPVLRALQGQVIESGAA